MFIIKDFKSAYQKLWSVTKCIRFSFLKESMLSRCAVVTVNFSSDSVLRACYFTDHCY